MLSITFRWLQTTWLVCWAIFVILILFVGLLAVTAFNFVLTAMTNSYKYLKEKIRE